MGLPAASTPGDYRYLAAGGGETAQDVAFGAVVYRDDVETGVFELAVAAAENPGGLVPLVALAAGDGFG